MSTTSETSEYLPCPDMAVDTSEAAPESGRTFEVLVSRKSAVDSALEALAKRATRKGLTPMTWTWAKAYEHRAQVPHPQYGWQVECYAKVWRIPLTIIGDAPHYAGWTFVATLQHLDGENIVRTVPDQIISETYRTSKPMCDHCKTLRRRNDTFVLRHEDGRHVQVGSTCIADFLGSPDGAKSAASATMLAEACGIAEGGGEGFGCGVSGDRTLGEYLPLVAMFVREQGWMSRTAACDGNGLATADFAWRFLTDEVARRKMQCELSYQGKDIEPTEADAKLAAAAEAWAETLSDESIDRERGDYLHNLRAIARTGLVNARTNGIAASMVVAYERAIGRERERAARAARPVRNEHIGTIGKRETWTLTLDFVTGYDTDYGYTTVLKFRSDAGETIVWKASNTDVARSDVGKRYSVKGTVKKHDEYKGTKQTLLSRCVLTESSAAINDTMKGQ